MVRQIEDKADPNWLFNDVEMADLGPNFNTLPIILWCTVATQHEYDIITLAFL